MDTRKAQLGREWQALTDEHERQLESVGDTFDAFQAGKTVDPLAIVGAYRSGKTQLIYHLFEESWDRGVPAFYVGDPGAMLAEFERSDETQLEVWIEAQMETQLEAYANNEPDGVDWFPNVDTATKREYVESYAEFDAPGDVARTSLYFDEVEQSYRSFIQAMDKDDDNPLRKINDNLQDTIKVWSFGMISAFEFIGEADWGRMKEIRIPPLTVADVRDVLAERRPDATTLANTIWWLARGRTGLIIKLIDELPANIDEEAIDWLEDCAEADFKDTRLINNLWTGLDRGDWDHAISALLFRTDGLDSWQVQDTKTISCDKCQEIAINIAKNEFEFPESDTGSDAQALLDRNVERVFHGLAYGEEELFPRFGLKDDEQADAFLELTGNMMVSFEPASDERRLALESLEALEGVFATQWLQRVSDENHHETTVAVPAPTYVRDAFPPIAVNPERVSSRSGDELSEEMERGLTLDTNDPETELVSIRFCPTERTATAELNELTRGGDITDPLLLVVPDDEEFDVSLSDAARTYERHSLLHVETYQSNRFWSFVLNLYGRLESEGVDDPYVIDHMRKNDLIGSIDDREVRNTIETLYDQLYQVATDEIRTFAGDYRQRFSLSNMETLIWEEERLQGPSPYWSTGRFDEATIALSYLPVLGPEYESNRKYARLHRQLQSAIDSDLVSGGSAGFGYTEYFKNMFTQNGYSQSVKNERIHYRSDDQLDLAVQQTQATLSALGDIEDLSGIISKLDSPDTNAKKGDIPVIGVNGLQELAYGFLRAVLIRGVTTGSSPAVEIDKRLERMVDRLKKRKGVVDQFIETIDGLSEELTPPETANVGTWINIKTDRLEEYQTNLKGVIEGTKDLVEKCRTESAAAPIGYHYWFLLQEYDSDIGEAIDDYQSDIHAANVNDISDAKALFDNIYTKAEESDAIPLHFDSREALLKRIEELGNEVFNLEHHHGATAISLPEDLEDLQNLNKAVGEYMQVLSQLETDLDAIDRQSASLEADFETAKSATDDLLTPSGGDSE